MRVSRVQVHVPMQGITLHIGFIMVATLCHTGWPLTSMLAIAQRFRCLEWANVWHANGTLCPLPPRLTCWLLVGLFSLSPLSVIKFTLWLPLPCTMPLPLRSLYWFQHGTPSPGLRNSFSWPNTNAACASELITVLSKLAPLGQ